MHDCDVDGEHECDNLSLWIEQVSRGPGWSTPIMATVWPVLSRGMEGGGGGGNIGPL